MANRIGGSLLSQRQQRRKSSFGIGIDQSTITHLGGSSLQRRQCDGHRDAHLFDRGSHYVVIPKCCTIRNANHKFYYRVVDWLAVGPLLEQRERRLEVEPEMASSRAFFGTRVRTLCPRLDSILHLLTLYL